MTGVMYLHVSGPVLLTRLTVETWCLTVWFIKERIHSEMYGQAFHSPCRWLSLLLLFTWEEVTKSNSHAPRGRSVVPLSSLYRCQMLRGSGNPPVDLTRSWGQAEEVLLDPWPTSGHHIRLTRQDRPADLITTLLNLYFHYLWVAGMLLFKHL